VSLAALRAGGEIASASIRRELLALVANLREEADRASTCAASAHVSAIANRLGREVDRICPEEW